MFFLIERTEIEITAQQVTSNLNDLKILIINDLRYF